MKAIAKRVLLFFTICAAVICVPQGSPAQNKLRTILEPKRYLYPNRPVEIVSISVADRPFLNMQTHADSDWLLNLNITVKNTSGKDIVWIATDLILREEEAGRSRLVIPVYFGQGRGGTAEKLLPAGLETTLKARKDDVDYWLKYCKTQGIEDIDKIIVDIRSVLFTDDTGWYVGVPTRKDPQSERYRPVMDGLSDYWLSFLEPSTNVIMSTPGSFFFAGSGKSLTTRGVSLRMASVR